MRLDRKLWEESAALVEACLDHPFVTGLRDGTLPAEAFRAYVAQDVFFLEAFCRAYALGLARSTDNEALETFSQLITGVGEELKLHTSYAAKLGIDLGNVVPNRATRSYTDFLLATAWQGSLGEILAAMTPCMCLYSHLGQRIAEQLAHRPAAKEPPPYGRWVATYSSSEFQMLAKRLADLLNRCGSDTPEIRRTYRYAMKCELEFFEEALASAPRPVGRP